MSNTDLINFDNTRGANYGPPTNVVFSNGLYRIPAGHVLDARPGVILFNGSLLDNAPNGNLIQGTTFPAPNTVESSGNTNTSILSSYDVTATDNIYTAISASANFDVIGGDRVAVIASSSGVQSTITNHLRSAVIGSGEVVITAPDPSHDFVGHTYVLGSFGVRKSGGSGYSSGFVGSGGDSEIKSRDSLAPGTTLNRITQSGFLNSGAGSIDTSQVNVNGLIGNASIIGSGTCRIYVTDSFPTSLRTVCLSSVTSDMVGCQRTTLCGALNAVLSGCDRVFATGSTPTATSVTNCAVFGTTSPTASNQAAFGTDILVRNNRDLTVEAGFSSAAQGHIGNYREVTTGTTTLLVTDGTIKLSPGTTLTLPLSSTMAANYPLDKDRNWTIIADPVTLGNLVPPVMNVTAPNLINGKTNWTSHVFRAPGQRLRLSLVNTASTTGWYIADDVEYNAYVFTTVDNNFGVAPPQSDANQLPLTANKAAHDVIGAASYVRFEGLTQNASNLISVATPPGFAVNIVSGLDISYSFEIFFSANAAAGYIIRADLFNVTTNTIVTGSYIEIGGNNGREGTQIVSKTCRGTVVLGANTFQLRISQDTANPISAAASIRNVQVNINAGL